MMKRGFGLAIVAALLVLSLPLSAVVAHNGNGNGHGRQERITICHKPNSAHPVTITIAKAAWKAHKAHGDTEGPCQTPRNPKPTQGVCTFDATTSSYYTGSSSAGTLYATGPIHFSWTAATGVVAVPGGYWNELVGSTTYFNNVTAGTVSGTGAVSLSFSRTVPNSYSFTFSGQLTANTLSGTMDGNFFTATGTVNCTGTTASVCTFDAATSAYYGGSSNTAPLYATGPIHFSWTVATGVVAVPGGYWNETAPPPPAASTTYFNNITAGTMSGTGTVNLSFVRTVPDSNSFAFAGQLTGNTLTGMMAGNYFTATGTVSCTGTTATNTQHRDDNEDDD